VRERIEAVVAAASSLHEALARIVPILGEAGIASPEEEIRAIARAVQDLSRRGEPSSLGESGKGKFGLLADIASARCTRIPLDRIIGERGFWTLDLSLNEATLSPRADTETVVRAALDSLKRLDRTDRPLRILDLGTGTGAILLSLLAELPDATGIGIDKERRAIEAANANASRNERAYPGLASRAAFATGDWFDGLEGRFDLIVSNPPYIPAAEIAALEPEVRNHDPHLALDGGPDGLDGYRAILGKAGGYLNSEGLLVLEIGWNQAEAVIRLAAEQGFRLIEACRDFGGNDRALVFAAAGSLRSGYTGA
jgi:release factor glutamine methyltransferase